MLNFLKPKERVVKEKKFFKRSHMAYVVKYLSDGRKELWAHCAKREEEKSYTDKKDTKLGEVVNNEFIKSKDFYSFYTSMQRNAWELFDKACG